MERNSNDRIDVDGHPENANRELNMQPGRLDDIESAEAYATRTGQPDVTGQMPGRSGEGERLHDREDMTGREGMAGELGGNPVERGERQARTGGGAGRVDRGDDIGHGIEARRADGLHDADGRIDPGDEIGSGLRARRADEQDPGNPPV